MKEKATSRERKVKRRASMRSIAAQQHSAYFSGVKQEKNRAAKKILHVLLPSLHHGACQTFSFPSCHAHCMYLFWRAAVCVVWCGGCGCVSPLLEGAKPQQALQEKQQQHQSTPAQPGTKAPPASCTVLYSAKNPTPPPSHPLFFCGLLQVPSAL